MRNASPPRSHRVTHCKDADVQQPHDPHDATLCRNPEDRDEPFLIRTCPLKLSSQNGMHPLNMKIGSSDWHMQFRVTKSRPETLGAWAD
jgi:hypothetical protein